jgi:hypothetical protein
MRSLSSSFVERQNLKEKIIEEPELQFEVFELNKKKFSSSSNNDSDIKKIVKEKNITSTVGNPNFQKFASFGSDSM